jgi:hypothetical protein
MIDAVICHSEPTGGRPSTLWSATAGPGPEESGAQEENEDADELVIE